MIEQLEEYAKHLNASEEVFGWLRTTGKKALTKGFLGVTSPFESELEHILDFLVSSSAPPRLQKMSFIDAKRKAKEWSEAQQKKGKHLKDCGDDLETVHDFNDGTKIVRLKTKQALQREGFLMSHCVGSYSIKDDQQIYSYRDNKNIPHATFEVHKSNGEILQIKGKGNGPIHPKYIFPILAFLKTIGMNIRPSEMVNLGYYHIPNCHIDFINKHDGTSKQMVILYGEAYAF